MVVRHAILAQLFRSAIPFFDDWTGDKQLLKICGERSQRHIAMKFQFYLLKSF